MFVFMSIASRPTSLIVSEIGCVDVLAVSSVAQQLDYLVEGVFVVVPQDTAI